MKKKAREQSLYNRKRRVQIGGYNRAATKRYVNDPDAIAKEHKGFIRPLESYGPDMSDEDYREEDAVHKHPLTEEQVKLINSAGLSTSNYLALRDILGKEFDPFKLDEIVLSNEQRKQLLRNLRNRSCGKKIKYPDRSTAKKKSLRMRRKYSGEKFAPYKCKFCPEYHVGHKYDSRELLFMGVERLLKNH